MGENFSPALYPQLDFWGGLVGGKCLADGGVFTAADVVIGWWFSGPRLPSPA